MFNKSAFDLFKKQNEIIESYEKTKRNYRIWDPDCRKPWVALRLPLPRGCAPPFYPRSLDSGARAVKGLGRLGRALTRYLKAVWPEIFGPVFPGFAAESGPEDPLTSPGPAPHVTCHAKSAPQTNSNARWWRTKNMPDCL